MRKVLLASPRGYCAGVDRAVQTVELSLEHYGAPVYVRKEIVHNRHVVDTLTEAGAIFVNEVDEVPEGSVLVFSAHGIAPSVMEEAKTRNLTTINATCPLVKKVHGEARRFAKHGKEIILIGHRGHEEVEGTAGEAPEQTYVVEGPEDVAALQVKDPSSLVWLSQTTLSVDETKDTVKVLHDRFPEISDPPSDDICYATQNRQGAVKAMAEQCDVVIVVGSRNSSNSVRLREVAEQAGVKKSYLVDYAHEIDDAWLEDAETVGVTSGASVPEVLVEEVVAYLSGQGFDHVEEVETVREDMSFQLPPEIRKAAGC
ncbi:4-hydroxy-3-methylbut-2-enyl diphosphate reductase [Lawsonella clevelandensis]|uniref:4-hydroxy-3-methylbut-2-enyl diphosphate reductase n=1 Tax=Lawsonella clevelandensis TaxID=1528099 RepID=A0A0M4MZ52_9ACTN|nr:4-hydroxy-3-methylbut-2-enyl diphosphate reductase [Lawsonella clevelandensis]ALE18648.1 4-hydroxy-3-methylbut-2-enyl diphosphate reductase [Lawsonella clevelandensis]ALE34327.1 4-hydroxy-3-methylbut-2-enyl diphosphate reductase [Lawsonella clevelandensis]MDU7192854.1 4-hydroxy-3-methylbut-2-enyl diphosphate reductase [Lawsonella clevelandensis]VHN99993.1 4-hydroxy-3-methylbut-2-enyl diphosphate reductase 1 [Lawsonella clevelandensis]